MSQFPQDPKKIRARITRYRRALRKEQETHGFIHDGYGKRYLLGPLYLLVGDVEGALEAYEWFDETFPDDIGEPVHDLCRALALYRAGDLGQASHKLLHTTLSNLYLIPHLLGLEQDELDIWHGSNYEEKEFLEWVPPEIWALWDAPALQWAQETYDHPEFSRIRARHIEIYQQLKSEPVGPRRSALVEEVVTLAGTMLDLP